MAKGNEKPKAASKITRNPNRRNGKAAKKNPQENPGSKGGYFGYSHKRLVKMAAEQGVSFTRLIEEMTEKLAARADRAKLKPRQSAARPGIGDVTYKMASVDRHFDKTRPYPCVPKGLGHAGKADSKTDTDQRKADRKARQNGTTWDKKVEAAAAA